MKETGKPSAPPADDSAAADPRASGNPFAEVGEAWKSAAGPWFSWLGAFDQAFQSRAAPVFENAAKALTQPDKVLENFASFSERLREMVALPQFADLPDIGKSFPSIEPTAELLAVAQQYLRVATPIWIEACKRFEAEAAQRQSAGEVFDNANDALELWNNTLDRTLMEFNRSSEFAELQQRYLHGSIRQKAETRRYFEHLAKMVDNPTRTELDDVYRRLHELHREVVALRRELDMSKSASETPRPAESAPSKKAVRKSRSARR